MEARQTRLVTVLAVCGVIVFGPGLAQWLWMAWRQHVMDQRLRALEQRHQELEAEHERLTSDPAYLEGKIRSTFKVAKPGEWVVPLDSESSSNR